MGFLSLRCHLQKAAAAQPVKAGIGICRLCLLDSGGEWNPTEGPELLQVGKAWPPAAKRAAFRTLKP
jgi:hypothetical protein